MVEGQKGVLVLAISPVSDTYNHLKPNDVILRFEGIQIASDGTVPFRCHLPLSLFRTCRNLKRVLVR